MKFFTQDWLSSDAPEKETEGVRGYQRHLLHLAERVPKEVIQFAREINLHDALVKEAVFDKRKKTVKLQVLCGDLQVGYFDAVLFYLDVKIESLDLISFELALNKDENEILYDEIDQTNSGITHEMLFASGDVVALEFKNMTYTRKSVTEREVQRNSQIVRVVE